MRHLRTSIEIETPAHVAWALISEFEHWPEWGPTVTRVISEADSVAQGVTGKVQTLGGALLPFEITDLSDGRRWSWKVAGVEATGHEVEKIAPDRCRVVFTVPAVFFPYVAVLKLGLRRLKALAERSS